MTEEYEKLRDILRSNIQAVKDIADNLVFVRDKLEATQETLADLVMRVEELEAKSSSSVVDGVVAFEAPTKDVDHHVAGQTQALDLEYQELPNLIMQHPSWLRPFSVAAEVEYHELEEDVYRLLRSKNGYLRVVRLNDGTVWGYFEEMSKERFQRIPLLSKIFEEEGLKDENSWIKAWTSVPLRLQTLQRGSRWEMLEHGQYIWEKR